MSAPTTSSFWNQTTPAPAAGMSAADIQSDNATPQDSRTVSVPNTGGVLKKTANYTAVAGDCGQLVSFNSGSAVAYTLPATPPVVAVSRWQVGVENIGAGALTISATTAAKLDGVTAGTLVLAQNTGCKLYTDGTDYFTERGAGSTLVLKHDGTLNGSQTELNAKGGPGIIISDDGVGGLTFTASSVSTAAFVQGASGFANAGPVAVPFASANTLGNCLVAVLCWSDFFSGFTSSTLSDSKGNTYTRIGGTSVNNVQTEVWVALNCAAGSNTVTASAASLNSNQVFSLAIHEYSGVATASALDVYNVTNSTTSVSTLTCSVTTTQAGDLLIIAGGYEGAATVSASSAPGTARETVHSTGGTYPTNVATFDAVASSAGAASTTITWASTVTESAMIVVALKATVVTPLTNPMTTAGDIIVGGSSGTPNRLAKGADGTVLTMVSGAEAWVTPGGGSVPAAISSQPDWPPASPTAYDDEFTGSSLGVAWTWLNQGSASMAVGSSWAALTDPASASGTVNVRGIYETLPASPWQFDAKLSFIGVVGTYIETGIMLRESSTGKLILFGPGYRGAQEIDVTCWTSPTAFSSVPLTGYAQSYIPMYFRVKDDGTNLIFSISRDGVGWVAVYTASRTAFFTGSADGIGIGSYSEAVSGAGTVTISCDFIRRTL